MLRAWLYRDMRKHAFDTPVDAPMLQNWCDFRHGTRAGWGIYDGDRMVRQTCLRHLAAGCIAVLREWDEPLMNVRQL